MPINSQPFRFRRHRAAQVHIRRYSGCHPHRLTFFVTRPLKERVAPTIIPTAAQDAALHGKPPQRTQQRCSTVPKTSIDIQVGSKDGQTITINLAKLDSKSLNLDGFNVNGYDGSAGSLSAAAASDTVDGVTLGSSTGQVPTTSIAFEDANGSTLSSYTLVTDADGDYFAKSSTGDVYAVEVSGTGAGTSSAAISATVDTDNALSQKSEDPLASLDSALKGVDDLRSDLGAVQNRLDSAINNISSTEINISSARSRITDADYATEVSNLSKAQILQQAGTSVLALANQTSQGVLSLLR